jgi:hypothetical protein
MTATTTIAAHIPNLFDRSRFRGMVTFVATAEEAVALEPDLVIVDLDRCDDVAGFRIDGPRVIGFGPHVDTNLHRKAVDAGYTEILARSVFFKRLPELLGSSG